MKGIKLFASKAAQRAVARSVHRSEQEEKLQIAYDHFRLSWTVDFYYPDSRLRHPRSFSRDTDERGAKRFAHRWGLEIAS